MSDSNNINEMLPCLDFSKIPKANLRKVRLTGVLGVHGLHFVIYFVTFVFSIVLIVPYLLCPLNHTYSAYMSIGASGIGAAILGYFIELASQKINRDNIIKRYNSCVIMIYYDMWLLFGNPSYDYMKMIKPDNAKMDAARRSVDKFIYQINIVAPKVDTVIFEFGDIFDDGTIDFFQNLKSQLVQFRASLNYPENPDHLIVLLEGIRKWLRDYFQDAKVLKLFVK